MIIKFYEDDIMFDNLINLVQKIFSTELAYEVVQMIEREFKYGGGYPCSNFYDELGTGEFKGDISLIWNDENQFIFNNNPENSFQYITSNKQSIKPKMMFTDGGSIPRILQTSKDFSPWKYAPA